MLRLAVPVLAFALAGAASAADTFSVDGTNVDGAKYTGTVTLTEVQTGGKVDGDVFTVEYTVGTDVTKGIGILDPARKTLAVTYPSGDSVGVVTMVQTPTGASGIWFIQGMEGNGSEVWTKTAATSAATPPEPAPTASPPAAGAGEITYERAIECAAATSYVTGMLRATPGADQAQITKYDNANSAWTIKLSDYDAKADMNKRIEDIQAKQQVWANDSDGMSKAQPIADDCVAHAPPVE